MAELITISTREIRSALHQALPGEPIVRLVREPVHQTVERLRLRRASGERQVLIAKLGNRSGTNREGLAYQHVLSPDETRSPHLLGVAPAAGWLFLAEAPGREPSPQDAGELQAVFEALGAVHRSQSGRAPSLLRGPAGAALRTSFRTTRTAADYQGWFLRAQAALRQAGIALPIDRQARQIARRLEATGQTLVHGDFHLGNVLVEAGQVRLVDWEDCGVGTPLHDLVYIEPEEGGWPGAPQGDLAWFALRVYHEAGPLAHLPWDEFLLAQRSARLWERIRLVALHAEKLVAATAAGAPPGALEVMHATLGAALARSAMAARILQRE